MDQKKYDVFISYSRKDYVDENALSVSIKRLRDKIEKDPANPQIIRTVRGMGYIVAERT